MEKQIEEMAWDLCDIPRHPSIKSCEQCGNKHCHAMYYAKRAYNACYRKQEWISVEERLPEVSCDVLGFTEKEKLFIISYSAKHKLFNVLDEYDVRLAAAYSIRVTHWMPLPEPPKGE